MNTQELFESEPIWISAESWEYSHYFAIITEVLESELLLSLSSSLPLEGSFVIYELCQPCNSIKQELFKTSTKSKQSFSYQVFRPKNLQDNNKCAADSQSSLKYTFTYQKSISIVPDCVRYSRCFSQHVPKPSGTQSIVSTVFWLYKGPLSVRWETTSKNIQKRPMEATQMGHLYLKQETDFGWFPISVTTRSWWQ